MAGIYIHIPYCKTICPYCDFYKTANLKSIDEYVNSILIEISYKKDLITENIDTIYFGGGTPSVFSSKQLQLILKVLAYNFDIADAKEITIELNPDDLNIQYFDELKNIGFNRLSIGIQSFDNSVLSFLKRRHNSESAIEAVKSAQSAGFDNISVDLIYGIPNQSIDSFKNDLQTVEKLNIQHLSSYHLGIEDNTIFGKLKKQNRFVEIDESESEKFYNVLTDWSLINGFEHYEVSNFAKNKKYSKHNMAYWFSVPYLGFGPSAHSYTIEKRLFNISNVATYIQAINQNSEFYEYETLTKTDIINEYIMLKIRTMWGINLDDLQKMLTPDLYQNMIRRILQYQESNYIRIVNNSAILTDKGLFISDFIIRELIV